MSEVLVNVYSDTGMACWRLQNQLAHGKWQTLWKNSLSLPILQTRPHLHLKNLSCTEDGLTVEEHHCSPGVKPEVLKERRDRKWLEPVHANVEERVCLHPPRSEETRDWEQRNSSSSEMSGNRTQRDKSCRAWSHSSIPIILMIPFLCGVLL